MQILANQLVAARGLLGWKQLNLARRIGVNISMISVYERGVRIPKNRIEQLISTFESEGISFINSGEECGVVMSRRNGNNGA